MPSVSVALAGSNPSPHIHTTALAYQASSNPPSTFAPSVAPPARFRTLSRVVDRPRGNRIPRRLHEPAKQEYSPYSGIFRPSFIPSRPVSPAPSSARGNPSAPISRFCSQVTRPKVRVNAILRDIRRMKHPGVSHRRKIHEHYSSVAASITVDRIGHPCYVRAMLSKVTKEILRQ